MENEEHLEFRTYVSQVNEKKIAFTQRQCLSCA